MSGGNGGVRGWGYDSGHEWSGDGEDCGGRNRGWDAGASVLFVIAFLRMRHVWAQNTLVSVCLVCDSTLA